MKRRFLQSFTDVAVVAGMFAIPIFHWVGLHEETELPKAALSAVLLGPLWLCYILSTRGGMSLRMPGVAVSLLGSVLWQLFTLSESSSPAMGVAPWLLSLGTFGWFLLLVQVMQSATIRKWLTLSLVASATLAAIVGVFQYGMEHPGRFPAFDWLQPLLKAWHQGVGPKEGILVGFLGNRVSQTVSPASVFGHANVAAEFISIGLLIALSLGVQGIVKAFREDRPGPLWRGLFLLVCACVCGLFVLRTGSRAAVIAVGGALSISAFIWVVVRARHAPLFKSARAHLLTAGLVTLTVVGLGALGLSMIQTAPRHGQLESNGLERLLSSVDGRNETVRERVVLWANTAAMVEAYPIYGVGKGNFPVVYPEFASARRQHEIGRYSSRRQPEKPHNTYLHRIVEDGLGAWLYLIPLFLVAVAALRRLVNAVAHPGDSSVESAGALGILGVLILGLVAFPLHGTGVRLGFWALAAVVLAGERKVSTWRLGGTATAILVVVAVAFTGLSAVHARSQIESSRSHLLAARNAFLASEVPAGRRTLLLEALRHADSAVRRSPLRYSYELQRADLSNRLGRVEDAEASHRRALDLHPNLINAHIGLVSLLLTDGRLQEAKAASARAVGLNPIDPRAHLAMATVHASLGETSAALSEYRRVLGLRPDPQASLRCHINLALLLDDIGDSLGATFHLREAFRIAPSSAAGLEAQARILQRHAAASAQAELAWRRLLEVVADHSEAHFRVALAAQAGSRDTEALFHMEAAIESDPGLTVAFFHRGEILARMGRLRAARDSVYECMKRCGVRGRDMPLWERCWSLAVALDQRLQEQERKDSGK